MPFGIPQPIVATVLFLVGIGIVMGSVEVFVETVAESAVALGVSAFFLTVVLAGTDIENAILGLAAVVDRLPDLALGTVFGEALFVLCVAVGIAGVITPFETTVPRTYLLMGLGAPALLVGLAIDGTLSRFDGILLTLGFFPLLAGVYLLERRTDTRYLSVEELEDTFGDEHESENGDADDDDRAGWVALVVSILAVVGMTVGSELAVTGARDLLNVLDVTGLAFGATVMSLIASIEELFLTVEPARQGRPHLGVGNVVGSILFFVTANVGVIALVHPLSTTGAVVTIHWPFFLGALLLVTAILYRGRVGRPEGVLLLTVYAGYWAANYASHLPL
jgi:cation:H+ antiporter